MWCFSNCGMDKMFKKKLIKKWLGYVYFSNKEYKVFIKCGRYFYEIVFV